MKCDAEIELWGPHPGCREYMTEPEALIRCEAEATVLYVVKEFHPEAPQGEWALFWGCPDHPITSGSYSVVEAAWQVSPYENPYESFYDYDQSEGGTFCPYCSGAWVTEFTPRGSSHRFLRHQHGCAYLAWRNQDEEADING